MRRALVLASALLLAGCAFSPAPVDEDTGGPVTLTFQSLAFQDGSVEATKKIVADWNSDHPDVTVRLTQGSFDSVHDQLVTQFQGGTAPDVIHDESADITGFARQGYLADISRYLSPATRADIDQGIWDTVTVDGKVVGAPTMLQSYVVFANPALLPDPPTGTTLTWDDLAAAAKRATTGGVFGLGWGLRQPTATVLSLGLNYGGGFFTGSGDATTVAVGDRELEVPRRIHDMAWVDGSLDRASLTQNGSDVVKAFLDGRYAMIVGGSYVAQQLSETAPPGFRWVVLPPLAGTSAAQAANPQTLSVPADSPHLAEAAQFVDFFLQARNLAAVARGEWLIPTSGAARAAILADTGGQDGWPAVLAGAPNFAAAPFQKVERYPQWKDRVATPSLQRYLGDRTDLPTLRAELTDGWTQLSGR